MNQRLVEKRRTVRTQIVILSIAMVAPAMSQLVVDESTTELPPEPTWVNGKRLDFIPNQSQLLLPPPKDAVVLLGPTVNRFLGKTGDPIDWKKNDSVVTATRTGTQMNHIVSTVHFRDADIHVEFRLPPEGSGNSGIYIHGNYELQIHSAVGKSQLTHHDIGALYGFQKPLANAAKPPGEWQMYDIRYRAPRRATDGSIITPGKVTAWLNGILVQHGTEFGEPRSVYHPFRYHTTEYLGAIWKRQKATSVGPLFLQDHDSPVQFRNVWIRPLDDKMVDDSSLKAGSDGDAETKSNANAGSENGIPQGVTTEGEFDA